jgi:DNA-binding beta-propeller fold protein YncE
VLVLVAGSALDASVTRASFEKVGSFGTSGDGILGASAVSVAVNDTSGDIYVATGFEHRVTRYNSGGTFLEAWGWGVANHAQEFQTCGPEGERACEETTGEPGEHASEFDIPIGVAVNQTTGNVYVLDEGRKKGAIQEFSANGKTLIASFGESSIKFGEPVSNSPSVIHSSTKNGIALDAAGNVYVVDDAYQHEAETRVMVFTPKVGSEFKEYEYSNELFKGLSPTSVAVDSTGDVFVNRKESAIAKFVAGKLQESPFCESHEATAGIGGITADQMLGGLFFYDNTTRLFHKLNPSCESVSEFKGISKEAETDGLAYNPGLVWGVGRASGVLYAIDTEQHGLIFAGSLVEGPRVDSEVVGGVGEGVARLEARIDPRGSDTGYRFQYGSEDCAVAVHACVEVPLGGADLGSGQEDLTAAVTVGGLLPGTTYHFRVLASSHCNEEEPAEVCSAEGADSTFTTFGVSALGLPDGRAFELVSPPVKDGGEVLPENPAVGNCHECMPGINDEHFPMQSAPDGNSIVYEGFPFSTTGAAVNENEYFSARSADGWGTRDLSPALEQKGSEEGYKAFSTDLSEGVLYEIKPTLTPQAPADYPNLYLQDSVTGGLRALVTETPADRGPVESGPNEFKIAFAGASSDFDHLIFEANDALQTETVPAARDEGASENNLYEWVNGALRLVNVLPGNTESQPGAVFGSGIELQTTAKDPDYSHAISADGSRIFWTGKTHGPVYVRENANTTLEIPDGDGARFLTASATGSKALLNDGHLYNLEGETPALEADLTEGQTGFQGILGASEDLSSVYFVDTAVLSGEENSENEKAEAGKNNLYLWHNGATVYIATLAAGDDATEVNAGGIPSETGDWAASPSDRTAQVTPDGEYLAFMSQAKLTGQDNQPAEPQDCRSGPCFEVFEYHASTKHLLCASCNPTGEHPVGFSALSLIRPGSGPLEAPHNLLSNGRLFFDSLDTLSPRDTNTNAEDVYEYEPQGQGTCGLTTGCVFLISSGNENTNSSFLNATPTGNDVYFTTRSRLVPEDEDDLIDLYDARVNGGIPPKTQTPPCTNETTCKTTQPLPPLFQTPPSNTLTGTGNLQTPPPPPNPPTTKPPPTRTQLLTKALKNCHKQKPKKKRITCETQAQKRYGTKNTSKTSKHTKATNSGRRG